MMVSGCWRWRRLLKHNGQRWDGRCRHLCTIRRVSHVSIKTSWEKNHDVPPHLISADPKIVSINVNVWFPKWFPQSQEANLRHAKCHTREPGADHHWKTATGQVWNCNAAFCFLLMWSLKDHNTAGCGAHRWNNPKLVVSIVGVSGEISIFLLTIAFFKIVLSQVLHRLVWVWRLQGRRFWGRVKITRVHSLISFILLLLHNTQDVWAHSQMLLVSE